MKIILLITLMAIAVGGCKPTKNITAIDVVTYTDSSAHGRFYNGLIKLNDRQYLFVGKDGFGKTFDSTIITLRK